MPFLRACERQESCFGKEPSGLDQLAVTSDQRRGLGRQARSTVEGPEWREIGWQSVTDELMKRLRPRQVLEAVLAEVEQRGRVDELRSRRRDEDLPAVGDCGDPSGTMNIRANVSLVGDVWRARMDAHPHRDRERPLRRRCRLQRAGRSRKRDEERIALRVDLDSALPRARLPDDAPVFGQCLGVALGTEIVQESRGPLDVREQKGDRAGGKIALHRRIVVSRRRGRGGSGRARDSPRTRGTARRDGAPRRGPCPPTEDRAQRSGRGRSSSG